MLKTGLTDKQISGYLYSGLDIKINNFLTLKQPTLKDIIIDMDFVEYQSLVSIFLVNESVVEIDGNVRLSNYTIFCQLLQGNEEFNKNAKRAFHLFFGRDDIAVLNNKLYCGENFFVREEITEEDYNLIVKIILKFNGAKMPEKRTFATEKAKKIEAKLEKNRHRIRQRENEIDSITPLMARVEARHPNAGNLLNKTIYQLRLMVHSLAKCEEYDASIILAPYMKDSKIKHWSEV